MAEAFEASVRLAGDLPFQIEESIPDIIDGPTPLGNLQVLVNRKFGDGKAIMDLHHADFFP